MHKMEATAILLICLLAVSPSLGTFSAPTPIPFHASPIFQRPQETRNGNPVGFLPFFSPQQQQRSQQPSYSGFVPIRSFPVPPAESAPIPWAQTQSLPKKEALQGSHRRPIHIKNTQAPSNVKTVKGANPYPKKWIPISPDGKKIKPKNVEKRRKQIIVASSMTSKDITDQGLVDNSNPAFTDESQRGQIERLAEVYEPSPSEKTPSQLVPAHSEIPVEEVAFTEPHPNQRPYAYNHKQETSGSGFTPIFAAEAAASQHGAASGFAGEGGLHQISDGSGDRVLFHIHGEKGPKSYRFGYDTGKGPDRQFRYEERDDDGNVKGHFGYYDKKGKVQVVHYAADPKNGFSTDGGNFGNHAVL